MLTPTRSLLLAAGLTLSLSVTSCVSQDDSADDEIDTESSACAESNGVTDTSIDLGILTDLSGPVAAGGVPWSEGVQAFFDHANETMDGVNGRTVDLTVADHAYDPRLAIQRYREIEPDVLALPLSFGSPANNAIAGQLVDDCMPLVANNGSIDDVRPNVFYNAAPYESTTLGGMDWYLEQGNSSPRVALFYQGDAYGEGVRTALRYAAKERGFEVVTEQSYAIGDQSYGGQLSAIRAADPDLVVMASTVGATFGFFGEAQAAGGATWDWLGMQPTFAPGVLELPIAEEYVRDFVIAAGQPVLDDGGEATQEAFDILSEIDPDLATDPSSLLGWQAGTIMYAALLEADDADGELTRGAVVEALQDLEIESEGLGPDTYAYDSESSSPGVPYHDTIIVKVNPEVTGFLEVVESYQASDLVSGFYESQ